MNNPTLLLSELEEDLLKELFNIGIGKAAATLSRMIGQEILLSVPDVTFQRSELLLTNFSEKNSIASISQSLKGKFSGEAVLLFPENSSLEVVKLLLGSRYSDEMLADLKQEALVEIGNIVLNACVGAVAQAMNGDFTLDIPNYNLASSSEILNTYNINPNDPILLINIDLRLHESNVKGYLAFIFGPMSINSLHETLKQLIATLHPTSK